MVVPVDNLDVLGQKEVDGIQSVVIVDLGHNWDLEQREHLLRDCNCMVIGCKAWWSCRARSRLKCGCFLEELQAYWVSVVELELDRSQKVGFQQERSDVEPRQRQRSEDTAWRDLALASKEEVWIGSL
jgi:hypothetical protein